MVSKEQKSERQPVTISLDKETYQKYRQFCKDKHWVLSGQIELLIKKQMEEEK
jgi:hypothetical protein